MTESERIYRFNREPMRPINATPRRIYPFMLGLPPSFDFGFGDARSRNQKKKKKKQYWQTPQWWYQPYYWGGKDQTGSGYVTFTGAEPAKVRKYDKKYFGYEQDFFNSDS
jgi:hypothetical protein